MTGLPVRVGLRYSRARKGHFFLSFISGISLLGLLLGVVALTVVVSVMNGFDRELKRRILGAVPHVVVETSRGGRASVESWLAEQPGVSGRADFIERPGVIISRGSNRLVSIYGIEPEEEQAVSILPNHIVSGRLDALGGGKRIFIGRPLAYQSGIRTGDHLTVIVPEPSASGRSIRPRLLRVEVAGFFELDSEVDYSLALMHVDDLAELVDAESRSIRLRLDDIFAAPGFAERARAQGGVTGVSDWTDDYGDFFETVRMEKTMMFVLLTLIVAIAAFNIVSSLSMMVKEKQADIAVLRTLGMSPLAVMGTFVTQGAVVGILGTAVGLAIGIPLAWQIPAVVAFFEELVGARMLAGTYFDRLPTEVRLADLVVIAGVSLSISFLATLYPAWQAARLQPAAVLRHE